MAAAHRRRSVTQAVRQWGVRVAVLACTLACAFAAYLWLRQRAGEAWLQHVARTELHMSFASASAAAKMWQAALVWGGCSACASSGEPWPGIQELRAWDNSRWTAVLMPEFVKIVLREVLAGQAAVADTKPTSEQSGASTQRPVEHYASVEPRPALTIPERLKQRHEVVTGVQVVQHVSPLQIQILTCNRPASLKRLLDSLSTADYVGDNLSVHIAVDLPRDGVRSVEYNETVAVASSFTWPFGSKRVTLHDKNQGLVKQWLWSWTPQSDDERAIYFEDDTELSPHWYKLYRNLYNKYHSIVDLAGISLQKQYLIPANHRVQIDVNPKDQPYLYRLLGTWGFAPLARPWRQFQEWFRTRPDGFQPFVPGLITTTWYETFLSKGFEWSMWTQWFIKFSDETGLFTLYPNLEGRETICAHWKEPGLHYGHASDGPDQRPMKDWRVAFEPANLPSTLRKFDWIAQEVGQVTVP